jgi:hypothetical protein
MSKGIKENSAIEKNLSYFPYFNHKLYENPSEIQEEEYYDNSSSDIKTNQSLEDSSTSISHESIASIDDQEKLIPLNLLDLSPIKHTYIKANSDKIKPRNLFELDDIDGDKNKTEASTKEIRPDLQKYKLPKSLFDSSENKKSENTESKCIKYPLPKPSLNKNLSLFAQPFTPKFKVYPYILCNNVQNFVNSGNKFGHLPLHYRNFQRKKVDDKKKKKKQEFVEREGDWSCYRCKNINFSFRNKCNKCLFSKEESEKKFAEVGEALLKLADISIYGKKNDNNSQSN